MNKSLVGAVMTAMVLFAPLGASAQTAAQPGTGVTEPGAAVGQPGRQQPQPQPGQPPGPQPGQQPGGQPGIGEGHQSMEEAVEEAEARAGDPPERIEGAGAESGQDERFDGENVRRDPAADRQEEEEAAGAF